MSDYSILATEATKAHEVNYRLRAAIKRLVAAYIWEHPHPAPPGKRYRAQLAFQVDKWTDDYKEAFAAVLRSAGLTREDVE